MPDKYRHGSTGVNADLLIVVTSRSSDCGGKTIAWARPCFKTGCERPTVGHVNICPGGVFQSSTPAFQKAILVHELTHVLGFTRHTLEAISHARNTTIVDMFTEHTFDKCSKWCAINQWYPGCPKCVPRIVSPNVVKHARDFFACDKLNSVPLFTSPSDDGSHWSRGVLNDDSMDPDAGGHSLLSTLSLALLQDTGLYVPDYSMAQKVTKGVTHGYKKGCDFVLR